MTITVQRRRWYHCSRLVICVVLLTIKCNTKLFPLQHKSNWFILVGKTIKKNSPSAMCLNVNKKNQKKNKCKNDSHRSLKIHWNIIRGKPFGVAFNNHLSERLRTTNITLRLAPVAYRSLRVLSYFRKSNDCNALSVVLILISINLIVITTRCCRYNYNVPSIPHNDEEEMKKKKKNKKKTTITKAT